MVKYLEGGEQTTINSTITELFPALAFNNNKSFSNADDFHSYILMLSQKNQLSLGNSRLSFVNSSNIKSAEELINNTLRIRPQMLTDKLNNAIGILNYLNELHKEKPIEKVVWGYREKPLGVNSDHAGDIFIFFKKGKPKILGISLKAGTTTSKEPKLNSYVRTTLTKSMWKKSYPNADLELKNKLWDNVYSKIPNIPKKINRNNWLILSDNRQTPDEGVVGATYNLFAKNPQKFDQLYNEQNRQSKLMLIKLINKDLEATKEWIEQEFRLEKPSNEQKVPLILVKATGNKAQELGDKLAKVFPKITKAYAYLNPGSVQEWFIDVYAGKEKLTLLMTIRSDSEYRKDKQKGKLGAYMQLKLLYRGYK